MYRKSQTYDKNIEIGGKEVMTYMQLLQKPQQLWAKTFDFLHATLQLDCQSGGLHFCKFRFQFCFTTSGKSEYRMIPSNEYSDFTRLILPPSKPVLKGTHQKTSCSAPF